MVAFTPDNSVDSFSSAILLSGQGRVRGRVPIQRFFDHPRVMGMSPVEKLYVDFRYFRKLQQLTASSAKLAGDDSVFSGCRVPESSVISRDWCAIQGSNL